ncbi:MAG: leucine-rich repeat protein [Clostridia bacterium]|nr:leucine-rich repeat protein [Clostridia bacterium]
MKIIKRIVALLCCICCAFPVFFLSGCKDGGLSAPTGLEISEDYQLSWDVVKDAKRYTVEILDVDNDVKKTKTSYKTVYSLANLEQGIYEIRVKAIAGAGDGDSSWSKAIEFEKGFETGCVYTLINNTEYELTRAGSASGHVEIEEYYRGKPVTSIADKAFHKNKNIESIVIGSNVKTIGESAFRNCSKLTSITIPESVVSIGVSAFQSCKALTSVSIPGSVKSISEAAFIYCDALESLTLGEGVEKIEAKAFAYCEALKEIVLPNSVQSIGDSAFLDNLALTKLTIGSGVKDIAVKAFHRCEKLETITFAENSTLKALNDYTFAYCNAVKSIALPQGMESIGFGCFYGATALEAVTVPDTITHIGEQAFLGTALYNKALENKANEPYIYVGKWVIACAQDTLKELTEIVSDTFRADTVGIADATFAISPKLKKIVFSTSIQYVGKYAFYGCIELTALTTTASLIEIGDYAFKNCTFLGRPSLAFGLKRIGDGAFAGCSALNNSTNTNVLLVPDSLESVGMDAFKNSGLWNTNTSDGVLYAGNWVVGYKGTGVSVTLRENTIGIADFAFYQADKLQSVLNSAYPEYIGYGAFYECSSLGAIGLNLNVTKIEDFTFYKCSSLVNVSMPKMLQSIGRSAFYKCEKLNDMDLSGSRVTTIGDYAFYDCKNMKTLDLGKKLERIGNYAFYSCMSVTDLTLPDTLTEIGARSFGSCAALTNLTIGAGLREIPTYAFKDCSSLAAIYIPGTVKSIGKGAFYKCAAAREIVIGNGVETIGEYAFYGAENVRKVWINGPVQLVGKYSFKGMSKLTSITINGEVQKIDRHALYGGSKMTVYVSADADTSAWDERWNSSRRPVVYGCTLTDGYVSSVTVTAETLEYATASGGITAPLRDGFTFAGWKTSPDGAVVYSAAQLAEVPVGTTLYAHWTEGEPVEPEEPEEPADDDVVYEE